MADIRNDDIRKEARIKPVEMFLENIILNRFVNCLIKARTQPDMCEIAEIGSVWETEQRSTKSEI